jgi:hypothetical protein
VDPNPAIVIKKLTNSAANLRSNIRARVLFVVLVAQSKFCRSAISSGDYDSLDTMDSFPHVPYSQHEPY